MMTEMISKAEVAKAIEYKMNERERYLAITQEAGMDRAEARVLAQIDILCQLAKELRMVGDMKTADGVTTWSIACTVEEVA